MKRRALINYNSLTDLGLYHFLINRLTPSNRSCVCIQGVSVLSQER